MQLKRIEEKGAGRFTRRYDLHYTMKNGAEKIYEMIARTPLKTAADVGGGEAEGVVIVVLNEDGGKVLLNREFRPAVNDTVYNFPAGLRDPGESFEAAAARELWEETGLHSIETLAVYEKSYGSVGLSNEAAAVCVCRARETEPFAGNGDPAEEIEPVWIPRAEAEAIARCGRVTGRVQMFLMLWGGALAAQIPPKML